VRRWIEICYQKELYMKSLAFTFAFFGLLAGIPALAQQTSQPGTQIETVEDEIIVTGTKQTDPAMSAFLAGDYATAEIEFDRNAFCALRVTRNFEAGRESAREGAIRSEVGPNIDFSQDSTAGGSTRGSTPTAGLSTPQINTQNNANIRNSEKTKKRTCENRGFQIYMKGLSQLELGKQSEAKKTLAQATKIHRTLYDAHFKLALLEYQEGNTERAKKELKKLKKIAARCKRCDAKPEIEGQVQYLDTLLNQ